MTDYDAVAELLASQHRLNVAKRLADGESIPTAIADDTGMDLSKVSRALGELRDHGMAELLVPEDRKKGRIYGLADDGRAAVETVADIGGGTA